MYNSYASFWADYRVVANYYLEFSRNINWMAAPDPKRAYGIYQQARNVQYGTMVMGRTTVDEHGRTPAMFGNALTEADHAGLGVITHADEAMHAAVGRITTVATGGMVMHYYAGVNSAWRGGRSGYHFLYNDAWLLGGAHGGAQFNLASPRWQINLWDSGRQGLTATGREAVFLDAHGYRISKTGHQTNWQNTYESFVSVDQGKSEGATFHSLVESIRSIKELRQLWRLIVPGAPHP